MGKIITLLALVLAMNGCWWRKIVKVPVPVPCLTTILAEPAWPLAAVSLSDTARALVPGNEYLYLDPAMATIRLQRSYIKALKHQVAPCLKKPRPPPGGT